MSARKYWFEWETKVKRKRETKTLNENITNEQENHQKT